LPQVNRNVKPKHIQLVIAVWTVGGVILIGTLFGSNQISFEAAASSVAAVLVGATIAILVIRRRSARPPASKTEHISLQHIYIGLGLILIVRAFIRGWTVYDVAGLVFLIVILTGLYWGNRLKKRRSDRSE
jgi:hypothetical protein